MDYVSFEEFEAAKSIGISRKRVQARIESGWEKERALSEPLRTQRDLSKWLELAAQNGINKGTFYSRVATCGWTEERAATEPRQYASMAKAQQARRVVPLEAAEVARANGISHSTLHTRLRAGWTLDRAVTEPPRAARKEAGPAWTARLRREIREKKG